MRSLLSRSVVAAVTAIVVAVVAAGVTASWLASRDLHRALDRSLRERAVSIAQLSASAPALLVRPGSLDSTVGGVQLDVEVVDRRNRIVARSLALGGRILPVHALAQQAIASGRGQHATVQLGPEQLRVYAAPLADFGGAAAGGAVVVAGSEQEMNRTLGDLHLFLALAGGLATVVAGLMVAALMRRALRPVRLLANAASEVERTADPRRRLPESAVNDEVGRLGVTLNAMLASLERSRNLERRFLADASHELRTPLTALRGNVDYLVRHGVSAEVLSDLQVDAERLARLADDLLALSREEGAAPPADEVRLDELARSYAGGTSDVRVDATAPVRVRGSSASLERALANLVENARKHGPPNGTISIEVDEAGGRARITVADEGPGLRAEESKLAFERFWRRTSGTPGSGLGLAIVRATAERHGGRAYAQGSRFTIELPALRDLSQSVGTTTPEESKKGSP